MILQFLLYTYIYKQYQLYILYIFFIYTNIQKFIFIIILYLLVILKQLKKYQIKYERLKIILKQRKYYSKLIQTKQLKNFKTYNTLVLKAYHQKYQQQLNQRSIKNQQLSQQHAKQQFQYQYQYQYQYQQYSNQQYQQQQQQYDTKIRKNFIKKNPLPKQKAIEKKQPIKKTINSSKQSIKPITKSVKQVTQKIISKNMKTTQETTKKALFLITGNKNKLLEFQQILTAKNIHLESQNIDLPELQGKDLDIAKEKALIAFQKSNKKSVLTEDTSLCFNAYKGLPGPYIKWFLDSIKPEGLHKMLSGFDDKTAYAQCIITYMSKELKEPICFIGQTPGVIVFPRGDNAFGWDPIFQPDGYDKTYAELSKEEKNKISHRFRAIEKMLEYFNKDQ
ncbi:hypothetical protein IMG5_201430 [Ichthyophthirius multifiliis]|uniref:Inosine triphosphate pyrophosphatase n=1 Tax=Ichthyophthirius multifiliis TaxID=5932 RepID=G0R5Z4_ICHMU|nr:hypothetical protein IMG5_201430 [Ichthyophthirius multifiliis]EGR27118.1 hypothetical protein IMG5_201430 [Ichthyophthirius multifiliis]|eukprot:XP_004024002.1 hypothetical protein IMG5_201430 [Ichthyophthirius multifiliis]